MASDSSVTPEPTPAGTVTPAPSAAATTAPAVGLPPVQPPSGKFIVQLFLVPGLIVGLIVGVLLLFTWLFGGPRSPEEFLRKLDDPNPDVRWRAAADLAQTLPRDQKLSSDPNFGLQLALRLRRTLRNNRPNEKILKDGQLAADERQRLSADEVTRQRKALEPHRTFENFLCACLGNFIVPTGGPVLRETAEGRLDGADIEMEPQARAMLRRQAVWGLALLGENLKRFDALPEPDQMIVLVKLKEAARLTDEAGNQKTGEAKELADWAQAALRHLENRRAKTPDAFGVDRTLETCAHAQDRVLREFTALACNFWFGTEEENRRIESALLDLTNDDGRDEPDAREWAKDNRTPDQVVCTRDGFEVRINATLALARRGSAATPIGKLDEMLDEDLLRKAFILKRPDVADQPHETMVAKVVLETLKALDRLAEQRPDYDLGPLRGRIDRLAGSDNKEIRDAAVKVKQRKGW
jgi:hypothetical protein